MRAFPPRYAAMRLRSDQRGAVAVEFALWTTLFFMVVMVALDFGFFYLQRAKMNEAVSAAALSSFSQADTVSYSSLPDYVRALSGEAEMSVAISCNGGANNCTNTNRTCACLSTNGSYVAASCGNSCSQQSGSGAKAGYYLTISAEQSFEPVLVPGGSVLPTRLAQQATVRLQ